MAKKNNKKNTIILLIILAISVIGGGIWTYNTMQPLELPEGFSEGTDSVDGVSIDKVFQLKEKFIQNIGNFLDIDTAPGTIWEDLYTDDQFNRLQDNDININIKNYQNNPYPFVIPSSTVADLNN